MTTTTQPFLLTGDMYEYMKTKTQNKIRYSTYANLLFNTLLDMFDWENLPDTIPKRFLESILHGTGEVFISEINGKLIASHGTLSGEVDEYGLGTRCIAVCPKGQAEGERGVNIAYGINNDTATPDTLIYWIAHLLAECDKSIKTNVIYSRLLKIPKVNNEKDKAMFEEIVNKVIDGEPKAFASSNALDLELGAGTETFELTDANKIDKLPYLSQFFEDCLKRFYNFYGQPMQNQNKRAQSISDEIHGQDSVSFIIPFQMLKCRMALAEEINRIFGTDISVDFSPIWKIEFTGLVNRDANENGKADIIEGSDTDDDTFGDTKTTDAPGDEGSGAGENKTEPAETETEPAETNTEEIIDDSAPDLPAMELDNANPVNDTANGVETKTEPDTDLISVTDVAELFGVSADEIKLLLEKGE